MQIQTHILFNRLHISPLDIRRHISCEVCDVSVSGGYDPVMNQVIVCQNIARSKGMVQGVLSHEMIHMFDYCNNDLDFKNVEHLACTEIRAANLTHCSFLSAWAQGDASPFKIKKAHEVSSDTELTGEERGVLNVLHCLQDCVKTKALMSVLAVRNITHDQAVDVIEKVFPRCYADLEPIGRRIRRNSKDMHKAYMEGPMYGYDL